jgi:hypothetical protein
MNVTEEELLLARVVDRDDAPRDWDELERTAAGDPWLWQRLARALREQCELRSAVEPALAVADRVALPLLPHARRPALRNWLGWSGWLAATFVGCAFLAFATRPPAATPAAPTAFELPGRALPPLVVEAKPARAGEGFEVLLMHRALEQRVVPALYELGEDDRGAPIPVPVPRASLVGTRGF